MINFFCWKWQSTGWRAPYRVQHVNALFRMLTDKMKSEFELACITDMPEERGFDKGIKKYKLWKDPKLRVVTAPSSPNCFTRLKLFDPAMPLPEGGCVSIDLDCLVLQDLTPLFTEDWFKIVKGRMCPYNGSMWQLRENKAPEVYTSFDPKHSPRIISAQRTELGRAYYGSDQGWLSHMIKGAPMWTEDDGVYQISSTNEIDLSACRVAFFPGGLKPWSAEMKLRNKTIHQLYSQYL